MRPTLLLMLAIGIVGSNSLMLSPIAGDVALSFAGATATDVLTVSAIYAAGTAISALTLAPQADRVGLRTALMIALALLGLALAASAIAPTLMLLALAQGIAGLAAGVALPATYGIAAEIAPKGEESATLGKVLTGWTLSLVIGVSLAAILADLLHWRGVFALLATFAGFILWSIHRALPQRTTPRPHATPSPFRALRLPGVGALLLSVLGFMMAFYGIYAYLGPHLTEGQGISTSLAGLVALSYGLGFGAVAPLDRLIDRYGAQRTGPIIFALLGAIYLIIGAAGASASAILIIAALWGAINHLGMNILVGQLTSIDPHQRGAIMGLYSATTYAAMFAGTALFRPVFTDHGFAATATVSALCILPAIIQSLIFRRPVRRAHS